jgi:hypothetical protein
MARRVNLLKTHMAGTPQYAYSHHHFLNRDPSSQLGRIVVTVPCLCGGSNAPQPGQNIRGKDGDSGSRRYTCERFLSAWFAVRKLVPSDDDGDQAGDLGNRAGEKGLQGGEAGIEGRATLRVGCERN